MELKQHFIQLVNEHRGTIRSLCKAYYRSDEDQKDAFQDVVLQLWKSFDSFRGESNISTWIYRVSLNTIFSKIRGNKKSISAESIETAHFDISSARSDDHLELLNLIVQSLKEVDKAIVLLYLEGYQNKEIADILKLTPTNVSTRFNRIKSQLKVKLTQPSYVAK